MGRPNRRAGRLWSATRRGRLRTSRTSSRAKPSCASTSACPKTEEVQETETITEKESEKDSQTTDRYELQAESQETINRDFSISAGVNTSGQYGLTHVDTSLDAAFSQSESQSRSSSINTAREIVTKAVERTFERVRRLRRLTITEEIRELNRHELANVAGSPTPTADQRHLPVGREDPEGRTAPLRHADDGGVPRAGARGVAARARRRANVRKKLPPFDVSPVGNRSRKLHVPGAALRRDGCRAAADAVH